MIRKPLKSSRRPLTTVLAPTLDIDPAHIHRARRQLNQVVNVAAIQREVRHLGDGHRVRQLRVFRIHRSRFAGDFDDLSGLAQLHVEVGALDGSGVEYETLVRDGLEALRFGRDLVGPGGQFVELVEPGLPSLVVTDKLVPTLVTVTLAFEMAAPDGSVTVPVNWPFWICANAPRDSANSDNDRRINCSFFIDLPSRTFKMFSQLKPRSPS